MEENSNLKDYLWPLGGTVLGLVVMPVAIAQYPEFFNENEWLLPLSVVIVLICWLVPLFLQHQRAVLIYRRIVGIKKAGPVIAIALLALVVYGAYARGAGLLSRHRHHLILVLAKEHVPTQNKPTAQSEPPQPVPPEVTQSTRTGSPRARPPKVKQWAVSTMIPFVKSGYSPGIPYEDLRAGHMDSLRQTYYMMAEFCRLSSRRDDRTMEPIPVSDEEARTVTVEALRYSILRWIAEIQNPPTYFSYRQGVGAATNTETAVPVPDAEVYSKEKLEEVLKATKFGAQENQHHWFWSNMEKFKFDVPIGTDIEVSANSITFSRNGFYKLQFTVEVTGQNGGAAGLPVGFKLIEPANPADLVGLMFTVKGRFEWYGEYADADPYMDWANGLFAGLDKRLKQSSPN